MHWDGSSWSIVATPRVQGRTSFLGVSAAGPDDVWLVGKRLWEHESYALVEHWDGSEWTILSVTLDAQSQPFIDVAAGTPGRVWAVSDDELLSWDGSAWSVVPFPSVRSISSTSISVVSELGWAAGRARIDGVSDIAFTARWDGASWVDVPAPALRPIEGGAVFDIGGGRPRNVWLVGTYWMGERQLALAGRWDGDAWRRVDIPRDVSIGIIAVTRAGGVTWIVDGVGRRVYATSRCDW